MRLYYYQDDTGNFGDDLNRWMWSRLLPDIVDTENIVPAFRSEDLEASEGPLFVGMGTLLNRSIPSKPDKVVFGSGVGYGPPSRVDDRWVVYGVRGPLSAEALGLDADKTVSDPALLLKEMADELPVQEQTYEVSFVPHHESLESTDWSRFCEKRGAHFISPKNSLEQVVAQIRASKLVVAEAMHGAIVADAFRVPWVPVRLHGHINTFKWKDWCQSVGLEYHPVEPKWTPHQLPRSTFVGKCKRRVKEIHSHYLLSKALKGKCRSFLSTTQTLDRLTDRLHERLEQLRSDHREGILSG